MQTSRQRRVERRFWGLVVLWGGLAGCIEEPPSEELAALAPPGERKGPGPVGAPGEAGKGGAPVGPPPAGSAPAGSAPAGAGTGSAPSGEGAAKPSEPAAAPGSGAGDLASSGANNPYPGIPTVLADIKPETPEYTQEALKSRTDTVVLTGTISCAVCTGKVLVNVVGGSKLLTSTTQAPGAFELLVPKNAGSLKLTVIADNNGNGLPTAGEPLGFPEAGEVMVADKPIADLKISIGG